MIYVYPASHFEPKPWFPDEFVPRSFCHLRFRSRWGLCFTTRRQEDSGVDGLIDWKFPDSYGMLLNCWSLGGKYAQYTPAKIKKVIRFFRLRKTCDFLRPVATGILRQMPPFLKSTQGPCRFFGARHTCEESKKIHGFFQICTCWLLMPTDLWIDPWVDDYGFQ